MAEHIFRALLTQSGLAVREEQIALCHEMLNALFENKIALCDAGVGIGKTHAYLVACILWQRYRPIAVSQPVVISTSSVALQEAILDEYIPAFSRILLQNDIIGQPIRAVVRKGKERFVCDMRLAERLVQLMERLPKNDRQRRTLEKLQKSCDLDEAAGLSHFDRRLVCVPHFCPSNCEGRSVCRYHRYLREAKSADISIQICNHNYLLADASHHIQEMRPLLADYRALVVDEAHKLPEAARQMYARSLSPEDLAEVCHLLEKEHYTHTAQLLREAFRVLMISLSQDQSAEADQRVSFSLTPSRAEALKGSILRLRSARVHLSRDLPRWLTQRLEQTENTLLLFYTDDPHCVLYLQFDRTGAPALCAASREAPAQLRRALWEQGKPAILTSGTLAAGGDFARTEQLLGLTACSRVKEFVADSPFDYRHHCLLYIPDDAPLHCRGAQAEAVFLSQRIEELVIASHGHALVLFTSYRMMGAVYAQLRQRLPFPLLEAWRGGQNVVRIFKSLPNAILFAAGPCWEGVDFPGDMVSLLIIARLPFPVPDPLSEAERGQYPSLHEYIQAVVIPDMQKKLRQGFGRAIRTETDTCAVAILDERAMAGGRYRAAVLEALPECPLTDSVEDVAQFVRWHKAPVYFQEEGDCE